MSAGTKPTSHINPLAIQAMNEIGIDISKQRSEGPHGRYDEKLRYFINMGCMDKNFCPTLFIPKLIDWGIRILRKDKPIEKVREIRDEIEKENQGTCKRHFWH